MFDFYCCGVAGSIAGDGQDGLAESFSTGSFLGIWVVGFSFWGGTFVICLYTNPFSTKEEMLEVHLQKFQHLFFLHGGDAAVHFEVFSTEREVEEAQSEMSGGQYPDFITCHAAHDEHTAEMVLHEVQLDVVLLRTFSCCQFDGWGDNAAFSTDSGGAGSM